MHKNIDNENRGNVFYDYNHLKQSCMNTSPNSETKYFHQKKKKNVTKMILILFLNHSSPPFIHEFIEDHAEDKNQRIFFYSAR